jgi:hypothetical protein
MSTVKEDEMKGGRMASPPYAPVEEHIRGILQDVRLNPLERCAAIELYYHTDWNTRRLKCRGVIAAHIRRTIGRGQTAAKKTKKKLEELGFIQGDYFDASAWVRSEVTGPKTDRSENRPVRKQTTPRPKTDHNTSLTSPSSLSLSNPSRPKQRASQEEDRFDDFMNFLENY